MKKTNRIIILKHRIIMKKYYRIIILYDRIIMI